MMLGLVDCRLMRWLTCGYVVERMRSWLIPIELSETQLRHALRHACRRLRHRTTFAPDIVG